MLISEALASTLTSAGPQLLAASPVVSELDALPEPEGPDALLHPVPWRARRAAKRVRESASARGRTDRE
jgi:hypothetical protein